MSATRSNLAPGPSNTFAPAQSRSPRLTFPVGARFPRRSAGDFAAIEREQIVAINNAPIFPIGARFPRRTPVDAVLYLAELAVASARVTSTHRNPIGARFPRR